MFLNCLPDQFDSSLSKTEGLLSQKDKHHRRSIRLPGYDYSQPGAYFVTICAYQRQCLFGEIIDGQMRLNQYGAIVADEWQKSSIMRREIELDAWVVMPNHFHGIVIIENTIRKCDRTGANDDHVRANNDHVGANNDHVGANNDHVGANNDHVGANNDHVGANNDHVGANNDHVGANSRSPLQCICSYLTY
jgi:hypothetical protein